MSTNLNSVLRLEVQKARNDAFVWGVSTWSGYRWGGPADTATSGVEWLNILGETHEISIERGAKRDGLSCALEAGTLTATVYDAAVDPNTSPYIKPGTPVRLMASTALYGDWPVFTGVLNNVSVTYRSEKPTVTLSAIDRVKDLANISRSGVVGGTVRDRFDDLLTKHGIAWDWLGAYTDTTILAQNAYDSSLLNHLTLATTSTNTGVFVDTSNSVMGISDFGNARLGVVFTDKANDVGYPPGVYDRIVNLIPEPRFVDGLHGWNTPNGTVTVTDENVLYGTLSAKMEAAAGVGIRATLQTDQYNLIYLEDPTRPVYFAGNFMLSSGTANGRLSVQWFDDTDTSMGAASAIKEKPLVAGEWTLVEAVATPPAGAYSCLVKYVLVNQDAANAAVAYADGFMCVEAWADTTTIPYFDADSVGADDLFYGGAEIDFATFQSFVDIEVRYDSSAMANDIYINNLTYGLDDAMNPVSVETKYGPYRNVTSIATYGAYSEELTTNLETSLDVDQFATDILAGSDAPELRVETIRWNATDAVDLAAYLDIYERVAVEYTNPSFHIGQKFNVLSLRHTITASNNEHRWMVDVDLINLGGTN